MAYFRHTPSGTQGVSRDNPVHRAAASARRAGTPGALRKPRAAAYAERVHGRTGRVPGRAERVHGWTAEAGPVMPDRRGRSGAGGGVRGGAAGRSCPAAPPLPSWRPPRTSGFRRLPSSSAGAVGYRGSTTTYAAGSRSSAAINAVRTTAA
ncbi:hypothetical protein TPA0905_51450 [Streptomyces olivaceus]|nr:hypothetical protein TPA0905_51450 [Streptomyces olivaceus]